MNYRRSFFFGEEIEGRIAFDGGLAEIEMGSEGI
jgi:hypothetical protein